jgi:CDP-diacylglycerol--serine O-phosphatidyltransferase
VLAIFIAMVTDGLDGRIAPMTNTTSDFGVEYDSLADVIAFGLTPALVMDESVLGGMGELG